VLILSLDGVIQPTLYHLLSTLAGHHGFSNATLSSISKNKRHLNDSASNRIIQTISSPSLISTKGILYADGARAMVRKKQEDDTAAKIRHAQIELERAQKIARQDRNKKWKPVFQRKVRERNARQEKVERWYFRSLSGRLKLRNARLKFVAENPQNM
jgi:hypothetical protein